MSITLFTATTVNHALTEFSLKKSLQAHKFDKVVVVCDKKLNINHPYNWFDTKKSFETFNLVDYNTLCIKGMNDVIDTEHVLVTQYDGMACYRDMWSDEFLDYDYIGPPSHTTYPPVRKVFDECDTDIFPDNKFRSEWFVGGGGFSLRSKKLLKALQDDKIKPWFSTTNKKTGEQVDQLSEDITICVQHRSYLEQEHGIKFAPIGVAVKFGAEVLTGYNFCFGFHGYQNIPFFLTQEECIFFITNLEKLSFKPNLALTWQLRANLIHVGYFDTLDILENVFKKAKEQNER